MHRLTLPGIFWRDHYDRCGGHDGSRKEIADNGRIVIVELDDEALDDLRSDVWYYGCPPYPDGNDGGWLRSIIRSAQATERALVRQGIPVYRPK